MKTPARLLLSTLFACVVLLAVRAADDTPPPPADAPPSSTTPAAAPAAEAQQPPAQPAEEPQKSDLRRLDQPSEPEGAEADSRDKEAGKSDAAAAPADSEVKKDEAPAAPAEPKTKHHPTTKRVSSQRGHDNARVSIWHDSTLEEGEDADAVVSVFGSSTSHGTVSDAVVSVFGSSTSTGSVGGPVVSVLGETHVSGGPVGDASISVLGSNYVDAKVNGPVVAVLGNVELGPHAEVGQEVVCIGGQVKRAPGAIVHGQVNNVEFGFHFGDFQWLQAWIKHCLLLGRPLAFGPHLLWVWVLTLAFLGFYLLLALVFPRAIEKCTDTFEQRPGKSILTAFLVTLLTPAAAILLAITIIGTPALVLTLFIAALFGKAAMLLWLGRRVLRMLGTAQFAPVLGVLVGGVIVMLLYTIPIVGFVVAKLLSWIGIGAVVYTVIQSSKRNKPLPAPAPVSSASAAPLVSPMPVPASDSAPLSAMAAAEVSSQPVTPAVENTVPPPLAPVPPVVRPPILTATLPRAGFWIRIAASLLDAIIVGLATNLMPHFWRPNFLLLYAAYCIILWALRGTTVGGIVCNLKVVRLDDRPVDWPTALVRALGGFLSLFAAGLGFIWVAFDEQKQSWHDKIAGTAVVITPKGTSLV
jgi:uncharacterized RDD family membrane protein YckC